MKLDSLIYLLIFLFPSFVYSQSSEELNAYLENRVLADEIDVTIFELRESHSKIPEIWQDEINEAVYEAIKSTDVFRKITRYNIMNNMNASINAKATHYIAKLEVIEIMVEGKAYNNQKIEYGYNYTVTTNFSLLDVLRGTNVISELLIFSSNGNGIERIRPGSIGKFHKEKIKAAINKQFPSTYEIADLENISSPILLNLKFNQKDIEAGGNPQQLYVYTFWGYIGTDPKNQIPMFDKIGVLTNSDIKKDENILYKIVEGKADIISSHKKGMDLFITPLSLSK